MMTKEEEGAIRKTLMELTPWGMSKGLITPFSDCTLTIGKSLLGGYAVCLKTPSQMQTTDKFRFKTKEEAIEKFIEIFGIHYEKDKAMVDKLYKKVRA